MNGTTRFPEQWRLALWGLITIHAAIVLPFLLFLVARIFYRFPMNYNEGWNVMFTARLLGGRPLYVPLDNFPLTPMNYPPLSFAIIGGLSYLTGDILLTGRIVSLCSFVIVSLLIFRIIDNLTGHKLAAAVGALFWIGLMTRLGGYRLVMHDPQLLAHAFSLAALCLFSEWRDALTPRRVCLLVLLCCLAVFVKHFIFVVPVVLAIALVFRDRRSLWVFALAGIACSASMAYAVWCYGGEYFWSNFVDFDRSVSNWRMLSAIENLFVFKLVVVTFGPFIVLMAIRRTRWLPYLLYFPLAMLLGAFASRGHGVDINAWFDFFIAAAIVLGMFAGDLPRIIAVPAPSWPRPGQFARPCGSGLIFYVILASALLPFAPQLRNDLRTVLNYDDLRRSDQAYHSQVQLLKSIPGPALFENLLMGFDAGKECVYEPFGAAQLMVSGRMRERILTDAIRDRSFGAIVLSFNIDEMLCILRERGVDEQKPSATLRERWTDNTLKVIGEHYELLGPSQFRNFVYVPRNTDVTVAPLCPPRRDD